MVDRSDDERAEGPGEGPDAVLVHDWLVGLRGGERVLDRLAAMYGPTDLYTLVSNGRPLTPAIDACRIHASPLQRFPGASGAWRRAWLPVMPWAIERLRPRRSDIVISTSSAVAKSVRVPKGVPHVCYCHSPARWAWEQTADYGVGAGGRVRGFGLRAYGKRFRRWDRRTADRVTHFVANSHHTKARIERVYGRNAEVIFPPVRTEFFTPGPADTSAAKPRAGWFLLVAALEPYKRTDLVIDAARRANVHLRIAGTGSQEDALKTQAAGDTRIEFLGRIDDDALRDAYRNARGLIFPQLEDFGIIAAEAQACGCPVIARAGGGASDILTSDTGILIENVNEGTLADAMRALADEAPTFDAEVIRSNALRFSEASFDDAIQATVARVLQGRNGAESP